MENDQMSALNGNNNLKNLSLYYMNSELQLKNDCLNESISQLTAQLKEKCSKINELEVSIKNTTKWRKDTEIELQQCSLTLEKLTKLYNDASRYVQILLEKKSKVTKKIQDMKTVMDNKLSIIEDEMNSIKMKRKDNQKLNAKLENVNENLKIENSKLHEKNEENFRTLQTNEKILSNLKLETSELERENKEYLTTLQANEKILNNLKNAKEQAVLKNNTLNDTKQEILRKIRSANEINHAQFERIQKLKNEIKEKNLKMNVIENKNYIHKNDQNLQDKFRNAGNNNQNTDDLISLKSITYDSDSDISISSLTIDKDQDESVNEKMEKLAAEGQWARLKRPSNINTDLSVKRARKE